MLRYVLLGLCVLLLTAGCGDLTRVPAPPVPLSAISGFYAGVGGDGDMSVLPNRVGLMKAVAPNSLLTVHLPDIGGMIRRFKKTSLHELLVSPEMASLFGPLASSAWVSAPNVNGEKLLRALGGEFVLSIEDITLDEAGSLVSVRLVAGITVEGAVPEAEQLLQMISLAAASSAGTKVEKGRVAGTPFTRIVAPKPQDLILELAIYRKALIVGVGRESATAAINRLQLHGADSILAVPTFRQAMELCADPRDALRVHIDVAGLLHRFGSLVPDTVMHILKVAGLDKFRSLTTAARIEGKDIVVSTFLDSPSGRDFLSGLLAASPVDRQFFGRIPGDATSFSLFAVDGQRILDHLRRNLRPDLARDMEEGLAELRRSGLNLERDVFQVFGPRCLLVTLPYGRSDAEGIDAIWNHILGTALVADVRDPAAAKRTLAKLPKGDQRLRRREHVVSGVPVVSYRFDMGQLPDGFSPSYAYVDDFLVVALSEETLRHMLKPRSPATAKRYRDLFRCAPETVATLSYDDARRGLGLMAQAFLIGLRRGLIQTGQHVPVSLGPLASATHGWNPSLAYTVADERGIFMRTQSPTGGFGGSGGLSGLMILSAIAIPNFAVARQTANEAAAIATLHAIQTAQETFQANVARDDDGDGEGEFAFLVELMGKRRPGDRRLRQGTPLLSGLVRDESGTHERKGYRFRVYLPAEDGSPVGGHESVARIRQVDGDLAEAVMVVVAWPLGSTTGSRAFLMDGTGTIYACAGAPYKGRKAPSPDVLRSQRGNLASQPLMPGEARDGHRWIKVRE